MVSVKLKCHVHDELIVEGDLKPRRTHYLFEKRVVVEKYFQKYNPDFNCI